MSTQGWAVGRNMPGYLPETDAAEFLTWQEARDYLEAEMRYWASEEDEPLYWATETLEGLEDTPSVEAYVGAIFAVDGHDFRPEREADLYVEDAGGVTWVWWIMRTDLSPEDVERLEEEA